MFIWNGLRIGLQRGWKEQADAAGRTVQADGAGGRRGWTAQSDGAGGRRGRTTWTDGGGRRIERTAQAGGRIARVDGAGGRRRRTARADGAVGRRGGEGRRRRQTARADGAGRQTDGAGHESWTMSEFSCLLARQQKAVEAFHGQAGGRAPGTQGDSTATQGAGVGVVAPGRAIQFAGEFKIYIWMD